jgi:2'-5' RNA ligase
MRLFLAVELEQAVLDEWDRALEPLVASAPDLAWVPTGKRHLTLKFLGQVPGERLESIIEMTSGMAKRHRPFSITLREIGAFPNFRRARVVWIGVEQEPRLELMHHDVEVAGEGAGFELEGRPFRPHVTVARVREALEAERARELGRAGRRIKLRTTSHVGAITLFESRLSPTGARYTPVHVAPLGG